MIAAEDSNAEAGETSVGGEPSATEAAAGDADASQLSDEADMVDWLEELDAGVAAADGAGGSSSSDDTPAEPTTVLGKRTQRERQRDARPGHRHEDRQRVARAIEGMAGYDAALQAPQVGWLRPPVAGGAEAAGERAQGGGEKRERKRSKSKGGARRRLEGQAQGKDGIGR